MQLGHGAEAGMSSVVATPGPGPTPGPSQLHTMIPVQTATMVPPTQFMQPGLPAPSGLPAIGNMTLTAAAAAAAVAAASNAASSFASLAEAAPAASHPTVASPSNDMDSHGILPGLELMQSLASIPSGDLGDISDDVWNLLSAGSAQPGDLRDIAAALGEA
jgi:heat shock transcription factor